MTVDMEPWGFFADKNINVLLNKLLLYIIIQINFVRDSSILSDIHRYRIPESFVRDRIQPKDVRLEEKEAEIKVTGSRLEEAFL